MKFSVNDDTRRIVQVFAKHFAADHALNLDQLDMDAELIQQFADSNWQAEPSSRKFEHPGLHLGCPLSNDRRQLTQALMLWCPFGWPTGNYESIVSSRLGNRLQQDILIGNALRNFFLLTPSSETIVNGKSVTLDEPVQRGCQLFSRQQLRLLPMPNKPSSKWIQSTLIKSLDETAPIYFDSSSMSVDELLFALSDHVRVIHSRKGGTVDGLVERFQDQDIGPMIWRLVENEPLAKQQRNEIALPHNAAVDWFLSDRSVNLGSNAGTKHGESCADINTSIIEIDEFFELNDEAEFLAHWTRAERGPFPDQTSLSCFDTLFFGNNPAASPLDTLCRILAQKKLLGSGKLIRGGEPAVCFTEVPLFEFPSRRTFRPQLSRWDFELFGIAIRKTTLQDNGGKPVQYVNASSGELTRQAPSDVTFQVTLSNNPDLDWSSEREWRVLGNMDLRQIPDNDAVIFVADRDSADIVARLSHWRVVVVGGVLKDSRSGHN